MSETINPPVLVVGSGPTGLVLALTLAKNGVPVRIIEKDLKFHTGQRGAGLQPRTLELYSFLGVLPDILEGGSLLVKRCIYEMPEGRNPVKTFDISPYEDPTPDVPYINPWIIGQGHTEEILRLHLAKYNTTVELNTELVDFEQNADGVTVNLLKRDGAHDRTETASVKWLIGADGASSTVRKQLGLTFLGETREAERILLADIEIKGLSSEYWHSWGDNMTRAVYLRPTEYKNEFSLLVSGHEVDLNALFASREALIKFVKDVTNRPELEFGNMSWLSEWRPNIRMANKFGEGRVFITGDAAHVHPPTGGQGLNSGAQDAFNLAWKLSLVYKGLASPSLLESYTTERLPIITEMLGRTTAIFNRTIKFKADGSNVNPHLRPKILHQLGVNCRWSPILVDEQPEAKDVSNDGPYLLPDPTVLYAGDRAPDAPGLVLVGSATAQTTSLFKLFGPTHHTALVFSADAEKARSVLDAIAACPEGTVTTVVIFPKAAESVREVEGAKLTVIDRDGHAYTRYPPVAKGFPVVIVRPDGVVGAVTEGIDGAKRYFDGLFVRV